MNNARPLLDRRAAGIGLVIVVAANLLYLAGLPLILDPMISMEPFYIHMAQLPLSSILSTNAAWGPLYAVWLKPFVAALGDPLVAYAANLYALSAGVSILVYLDVLLLTRRAAPAAGAALFFLICDLNVPLFNKVSGFALMVVLAGLTVSELLPAGARRMTAILVGVLLASYARPELYPAALVLSLTTFWLAWKEAGASGRSVVLWPTAGLSLIAILALWTGFPALGPSQSGDRLLMAFREHFAWNWGRWHNGWSDLFSVWQQEFGSAQSLLEAFLTNPRVFVHHLTDNLLGVASFMMTTAFDHYPLLVPATCPGLVKVESLLVAMAAFGSLILVAVRPRLRRQMLDRYGHVLLPYALLAIPSLAGATLVFPQAYYLVIPGVLLMLAATLALTLIVPTRPVFSARTRVLAALACLMAVPKPFVLPSAYLVDGSPFKAHIAVVRTVTDTVAFIRCLRLAAPVHVLTFTDGIGEMLGPGFEEVKLWEKGEQPLETYLRDNDVAMIVSLKHGQEGFVGSDPYWHVLQYTPEAAGFTHVSVPDHDAVVLYVRADRLAQRADSTQDLPTASGAACERFHSSIR